MQQRALKGGGWCALALVEVAALGVVALLSRSATLIGDDHEEADDERVRLKRQASRDRLLSFRPRVSAGPIERVAQ